MGLLPRSQLEELHLEGERDSLRVIRLVSGRAWRGLRTADPRVSPLPGVPLPQEGPSLVWEQCQPHGLPTHGDECGWTSVHVRCLGILPGAFPGGLAAGQAAGGRWVLASRPADQQTDRPTAP